MKSTLNIPSRVFNQSAILIAFAAMLIVSWRRWTSVIADSGREMDLPLRLLNGEMLYRDVHYLYPPFSPYFNSQLYRVLGAHLDVLIVSGIVSSALLVALCYGIARRLLSPFEASVASIAVIVLCVFKPTGNLISPYAFAALYGTVFALGALLLVLRYTENRQRKELIGVGVLIGLCAITKQEFALAAAFTLIAGLIYIHRNNLDELMKDLSTAAIPASFIALPVYGLFFRLIGWKTLVEDCHLFYTHLPPSLIFYNTNRTGLDRPILSLLQIVGAAGVGTAALSAIVLLSDRTRKTIQRSALLLVLSMLVVLCIKLIVGEEWDGSPLRALPLLLPAFIIFEWKRGTFSSGDKSESAHLFIISIYSLAVLARVSLRVPSGGAFGGYFLPTSLILFCYLFLRALPRALERWTNSGQSAARARLFGQFILIITLTAMAIVFGVRYRRTFNYEITAQRGRLFAPRSPGPAVGEALKFIESKTRPGEAVAVLPEGSDLAFLTGRRMPLRHQILIPGLMSEKDEWDAIAKLQSEQIRYVLIVNRPMREFGSEAFGRDFYTTLGRWIEEHYRIVKVCGFSSDLNPQIGHPVFFIKILEKN